jgi:hypothetical protein
MTPEHSIAPAHLAAHRFLAKRLSKSLLSVVAFCGLAACAAEPVLAPSATDMATITSKDATGKETHRLVSATVIEAGGVVAVDVVDPSLGTAPARVIIETPMTASGLASSADIGTRAWSDTLNTTIRIKSVVSGVPRELAFLNATSGDTMAVLSSNAVFDGSKIKATQFSVRLATGQSMTLDVLRPYARAELRGRDTSAFEAHLTLASLRKVATRCANVAFTLLAPRVLEAQTLSNVTCAQAQTAATEAWNLRDNAVWIGGPIAIGGIGVVVSGVGVISATGGSGVLAPGLLAGMYSGATSAVGGIVAIYVTNRNYNAKRLSRDSICGGKGTILRRTSAPLDSLGLFEDQ